MGRYIFLDRDGTINVEKPDYVQRWSEFKFLPGALEALRLLKENGFKVFVVTNQSCVARNIVDEQAVREIHRRMVEEIEKAGGGIDEVCHCPHAPEVSECECRKPKPGMHLRLAQEFGFDLSDAWSVGDDARDLKPVRDLGGATILVKTGKSASYKKGMWDIEPDFVADDILAAARLVIKIEDGEAGK